MRANYDYMPPGSLGNGDATERLAELVEVGLTLQLRGHLVEFAVRAHARRLADAAECLGRVGYHGTTSIMGEQARLVRLLLYLLVGIYRVRLGS